MLSCWRHCSLYDKICKWWHGVTLNQCHIPSVLLTFLRVKCNKIKQKIGICGIWVIASPQYQPLKIISPRAKSFGLVLAYNKSQVNPSS